MHLEHLQLTNSIHHRIVGGEAAIANQFPWQVSIESGGCGGSLIHPNWVLTAAHCTAGFKYFIIGLGSNLLDKPLVMRTATIKFEHPNYNEFNNNLNHDIAVIKMTSSVSLTPSIQTIRLPAVSQASSTFVGLQTTVSGWGLKSSSSAGPSRALQYVNMRVISNADCERRHKPGQVIGSTICAQGWTDPTKGTCRGDSGGPMVLNESGTWIQVGVVSFAFNPNNCESGIPSGYVRTASYLPWINNVTGIPLRN